MQCVAVVPECDAAVGRDVVDVDVLVHVHDELALRVDLDQDLLLVHGLDHLPDVGSLFLEELELFAQAPDLK